MLAWHVTTKENLGKILQEGLRAGSYWSTREELRDYYIETVLDEGDTPVVITARIEDVQDFAPGPDIPGIDEPITTVLAHTEGEIQSHWAESDRTWRDSVDLIGSFRLTASVNTEAFERALTWVTVPDSALKYARTP